LIAKKIMVLSKHKMARDFHDKLLRQTRQANVNVDVTTLLMPTNETQFVSQAFTLE